MKPGSKHSENNNQVLYEFLLRGQSLTVHDHDFCVMTLAKGFKVAIAETHKTILVSNHHTPDWSQFNQFHESVELLALVVQTTANIREPFIFVNCCLSPWQNVISAL